MTEGTRTPAQQDFSGWNVKWTEAEKKDTGTYAGYMTIAVMHRTEEISSDVRALAATVAELERKVERLMGLDKNTNDRLLALESPGSAEAALEHRPGAKCVNCGHADEDHFGEHGCEINMSDGPTPCGCTEFAEAAPEPVCQCGHAKSDHYGETGRCHFVHSRFWSTGGSYSGCGCERYVQAEQAVQEPPALDPCIDEIITQAYLYGSARCAQGVEVGAGRDSGEAIKRMLKEWETLTEMIFAYGGDAREGGK